jgi:hypothetical protein
MATTTNYSWSTPDDTALVKDGAAAIRSLGTAIDTTVFTNAGAAINKTIVDAKGDLIVGSAADTAARLAVGGTNGHVLTVNSGATYGVEWAAAAGVGNLALITDGTLSGSSLSVSSLSTYSRILIFINAPLWGTADDDLITRLNGTSSSVYRRSGFYTGTGVDNIALATETEINSTIQSTAPRTVAASNFFIELTNCKNTGYTNFRTQSAYLSGGTNWVFQLTNGVFEDNSAISSFVFRTSNSYTFSAGTYKVYGE